MACVVLSVLSVLSLLPVLSAYSSSVQCALCALYIVQCIAHYTARFTQHTAHCQSQPTIFNMPGVAGAVLQTPQFSVHYLVCTI